MHHATDKITHTTAFVTPVVEHWLERDCGLKKNIRHKNKHFHLLSCTIRKRALGIIQKHIKDFSETKKKQKRKKESKE